MYPIIEQTFRYSNISCNYFGKIYFKLRVVVIPYNHDEIRVFKPT